jgi:hypothetical protein
MNWRRIPLGALGIVAWILSSWLVLSQLPAEPGPYSERPIARALLIGGLVGLTLMVIGLVAHPDRSWLWGVAVWNLAICLSAWDGISRNDSDLVQTIGYGFFLGGVVAAPLILASLAAWIRARWARRPRRWSAVIDGDGLEFVRRTRERNDA